MTKKINVDAKMLDEVLDALDKQTAEINKIRPLSRSARLKQAEASLKPKSRGGRLLEAEREIEASAPRDRRAVYSDMKPDATRAAVKPEAKAELVRAHHRARDAARR